jgi:hypothetical protein
MQEIGTMATSLPIAYDSSIFLVVDENQSHCMRALITGPKETPYQVTHKFKSSEHTNLSSYTWSVC